LEMTLQACHTYNVEHKSIEKFVTEEKKIPYFMVETDYSTADVAQLNTRIAAFIEMM
ncbi:MAG: 2-hydroxyacyl-CoA dehydratase, partial [Mogibacterium sp.]|nr:2-hydroxyacyl-CoA dehydratase [Mogibacterium sp.]